VRERLVDGSQRRYDAGLRRSVTAMRSARYFRLLDELDAIVADPGWSAAGEESVTVEATYRRVRKAVQRAHAAEAAGAEDADETLHRIRKSAKRLRYTAAATGASRVADRAKEIQTLLGDHQDSHVSRTHLLTQAEAAHAAGEDAFTYGVLYQQESEIAEYARLQLDDSLKGLAHAVRRAK
ncbi:MAG: CHAD domain-containing protein, partial [Mycobacterium sp.]